MEKNKQSTKACKNADIVICVHNALEDVKICIDSIYNKTNFEFQLIIVNDGSNKETSEYLQKIKRENSNFNLIENCEPLGYTKSANLGLKTSTSEYAVLMNSDVIVTENWLSQLIECADSDENIGMVGPISNAASWQSVPNRFDSNGDWAINQLPSNITLDEYSLLVKSISEKKYPRVNLLNGVCTLIKRKVFDEILFLDEINFPMGYGEENDFCLRAIDANFELVIDDSTYIFHSKSKSFGHQKRKELSKAGNEVLIRKYGEERLQIATIELKQNNVLKELRSKLNKALIDIKLKSSKRSGKKRKIIFLLPVAGIAGGIHSVFQEVTGMRLLNVDARIATWRFNKESYQNAYPNIDDLENHFYFFNNYEEVIHYCGDADVVIATINHSMFLLKRIFDRYPNILPAYYVQDYEPFFFEEGSEEWRVAYDSYTYIPESVLMAKTKWLCETVSKIHKIKVEKVSPSLDSLVYYPDMSNISNDGNIKIVAMIRPSTPRRGAERTMRVLKRIKDKYSNKVEINIFGTTKDLLDEVEIELNFEFTNWEIINRERVSILLRESDVFIDFSIYQAFGRTGLEAMACGCAVVLPERGGTNEYAIHNQNALLANTSSEDSCFAELDRLVEDGTLREKLKVRAITDSAHYSIKRAALSELLLFNKHLENNKRNPKNKEKLTFSEADRYYREDGTFCYDLVSIIVFVESQGTIDKEACQSISQAMRKNDELIVLVNNISKANNDVLTKYFNNVNIKIIETPNNFDKYKAFELGVKESVNPFVCFVNPNLIVPKNLFVKLIKYTDKKQISVVAPLLNLENSFQNIYKYTTKEEVKSIHKINEELEVKHNSKLVICKTLSLNCMILRKEAFNRVGRFNEYHNSEFVELDFIWRLQHFGSLLGTALDTYCFIKNDNKKNHKFDPQTIRADKNSLEKKILDCYKDTELLTPYQIWGIDNLEFDYQKTNIENVSGNNNFTHESASIVILTYNSSKTIINCLNSVNNSVRKKDEVIIVDNDSEDDTKKLVEEFITKKKQFRFIQNDENIGFSAGTNVGIKESKNPIVILLNPDTIVSHNWLNNLTAHFNSPDIGAVGPVSNYVAGLQKMELYSKENFAGNPSVDQVAKIYEENNKGKSIETKLLIGFCLSIRKNVLDKIGYLDENLFLGNDDLELSWRLRENGYKLKVATDTFIFHEGQQSFNTKPNEVTQRLVKESTDALYNKLVEYYNPNSVPSSLELWDMDWFKPSADLNKIEEKEKSCTIIVLTHNQLNYTKKFITSLKEHTDNYKLIVVDNNSNDGTDEYLKKLQTIDNNISVIQNESNNGFPKAVNQALRMIETEFVILANNDIVLTRNWLNRLIEVANSNNEIGIVGPISNSVSGLQLDNNAKYDSIDEMHKYAKSVSEMNNGVIEEFPRVAFLCTLIKREVIDKIGGLDERFSPGNFEDDDFCLRTQLAGYKTIIAKDVFIHHYGSVSFKENGEELYAERLKINLEKFIDKWEADPEGIWLKGENIKKREIKFPLNSDLYIQSLERAFINIDDREYDFALINLNLAIEYYKNSSRKGYEQITQEDLLNMAGNLALSKNELEEAKTLFEKLLEENPNSSEACYGLGEVFKNADMIEESKTMFEWAIENNSENQNAKIRLTEINKKLNLPEEHNSLIFEKNMIEK